MSPDAIVEHFNILKDDPPSIGSGFKSVMVQAFSFKCAKETYPGALSQQLPLRLIDVCIP